MATSPTQLAQTVIDLQTPFAASLKNFVATVIRPTVTSLNTTVTTAVDLTALSNAVSCISYHADNLPSPSVCIDFIDAVNATVTNITSACG